MFLFSFLLIFALPFLAAAGLDAETFAIILIAVCVAAGLTVPAAAGHAGTAKGDESLS